MEDLSPERPPATLLAVSNALVRLHKEQFGRGPSGARSYFAGPDMLICALSDALLPAERHMVELGQQNRVRESRMWFQAATQAQFVSVIEEIVHRKVTAFASGTDPDQRMVFEMFVFAPEGSSPHLV